MNNKELEQLDIWDCDNEHQWLSYPGPLKDTWHLEQLHESETATFMKRDKKSAWLVAGVDPSVCPLCAMRMRIKERLLDHNSQKQLAEANRLSKKISA